MSVTIIQDRLRSYNCTSKQEEFMALKEIYQEIALSGLARSQFFKTAAFQGGTALRIVYQLNRFSEDLDFILLSSSEEFKWETYLAAIDLEFQSFGIHLETKERKESTNAIKTAFLKEDSFSKVLELTYDRAPSDAQKITIKLEIDTHPPQGSHFQTAFLLYPYPFSILIQDMPSLFASKLHAILCRKYEKGRDWFDFLWYVSKKTPINLNFLKNALYQAGPYQGKERICDKKWVQKELEKKIASMDWKVAQKDIENFLKSEDRRFVANWSEELFQAQVHKLEFS